MSRIRTDQCLEKWASLDSASSNIFSIILMLNINANGMTQKELVRTYGLKQAAVSKTLNKLESFEIVLQRKANGEKTYSLHSEYSCVFEENIENEINKILKIIRLLNANDYRILLVLLAKYLRNEGGYTQAQMVKKFSWKASSISLAVNRLSKMEMIVPNLPKSFKEFVYLPNWERYESYIKGE